jgi:hypothetical protein
LLYLNQLKTAKCISIKTIIAVRKIA